MILSAVIWIVSRAHVLWASLFIRSKPDQNGLTVLPKVTALNYYGTMSHVPILFIDANIWLLFKICYALTEIREWFESRPWFLKQNRKPPDPKEDSCKLRRRRFKTQMESKKSFKRRWSRRVSGYREPIPMARRRRRPHLRRAERNCWPIACK